MNSLIVWDIETIPDLKGFAAANGHDGSSNDEIRAAMGDKFPKHIYHSIICIGALVAYREDGRWDVTALGAPHVGERPEKADRIVCRSHCRTIAAAGHVQRFVVRSPGPAISRNGACSCGARTVVASVLQSLHRGRN
jgi:hypothetical protein